MRGRQAQITPARVIPRSAPKVTNKVSLKQENLKDLFTKPLMKFFID
jgi:hypothetical protein